MDRILFTSATTFTDVSKLDKANQDKGVRVHSSLGKKVHNFFARFGFCSRVVAYKIPATNASTGETAGEKKTQTVYMNVASFNKWLKNHRVNDTFNPSDIKKDSLNSAIQNKIEAALKPQDEQPAQDSITDTRPANIAVVNQPAADQPVGGDTADQSPVKENDEKKTAGPDVF